MSVYRAPISTMQLRTRLLAALAEPDWSFDERRHMSGALYRLERHERFVLSPEVMRCLGIERILRGGILGNPELKGWVYVDLPAAPTPSPTGDTE